MTITGSADAISTINQFVDTLKFTQYTVGSDTQKINAFSNAVLTSFSKAPTLSDYSVSVSFDPAIYNSSNSISLVIPNVVTTRSEIDKPNSLFQATKP